MKPARVYSESNRRGFVSTIIVALIAFIVGVASIYLIQKYIQSRQIIGDQSLTIPTKQNPTVNWKMYTNTDGGYSFRYPESWVESTDPHNLKHFKLNNSTSAQDFDLYIAESGNYQEQSYNLKSQQAFGDTKPEVVQKNNNEVRIALIQGEPNLFYSVLLTDKSKYVWLVFSAEPNPVSQRRVLDQILSTFKFISDEMASWKTVKSGKFYIEFKYPPDWQYLNNAKTSQFNRDPNFPIYNDSNELVTDGSGCAFYVSSHGGSEGPTVYLKDVSISIANKEFTRRSWSKTEGGNGIFNYYFSDTFRPKVDPLIIWSWTPDSSCQAKIQQILTTFKFTE